MKSYWAFGHRSPYFIAKYLFGDRRKFGLEVKAGDPDWIAWQRYCVDTFYQTSQKEGIGKVVNDAGYRILSEIDFTGKKIMEIGPGFLPHMSFWRGKPLHFSLVDNEQGFLDRTTEILKKENIQFSCHLTNSHKLPFNDQEFDAIISFYTLEHLYPLSLYLAEFKRVLKPGGLFLGAIPAEGGFAWGLGRFFTSRRQLKAVTTINPDKIICWGHPNFAEDILGDLDAAFSSVQKKFWPIPAPLIDINLVVSFVYERK
jgi:SAM-dependent methyltransferase